MKSLRYIYLIFMVVFVLIGCSKTKEDYAKEYDELNSQIETLMFEKKSYDKAFEKAKQSLEIAKTKLKDKDKVLNSLNIINLNLYASILTDDNNVSSNYEKLDKYSYECVQNNEYSDTKDNNDKYTECILLYMNSQIFLGNQAYKKNDLKTAQEYFDTAQGYHTFLANYYTNDYLNELYQSFYIDINKLAENMFDINQKYITSLSKTKKYPSDKPVVMFLLDASGSMYGYDTERNIKIDVAKETITTSINKIDENKINTSLMSFNKGCGEVDLLVAPNNKEKKNILNKMQDIYPSGLTPLAQSITEAGKVLKNIKQYSRIVVVSDGEDTCYGDPCQAVKDLKAELGINVELFTIGYGVDNHTKQILQCMANSGGGRYFDVSNQEDFATAFNQIVPPEDRDSDWDGVLNKVDECPNTPKGIDVNEKGCPKNYKFNITFDFAKATLTNESIREVENFAIFLKSNPNLKVIIEGHTDAIGSASKNKILSEKRVTTVINKLVELGVNRDNLTGIGYGEERPIEVGNHKLNRRVEARLLKD